MCDACDALIDKLGQALADRRAAEERLAQVVRGRRALEQRVSRLRHQLEVVRGQLLASRTDLVLANRRTNDYHRRAQKMAAALSKTMAAGGPSFGRAPANAGHVAQRTLREAADAQLAVYRARYDGDLTPEEEAAAFAMEEECGHQLSWAQRDRAIREIRERRAPWPSR